MTGDYRDDRVGAALAGTNPTAPRRLRAELTAQLDAQVARAGR